MMLAALMVGSVSISYGQETNKKALKGRVELQETQKDSVSHEMGMMKAYKDTASHKMEMMTTHMDSVSGFHNFKKEADLKFANNEKCIADFKEKQIKLDKMDDACKEKISSLEQRNNELKSSLANYKDAGAYEWTSFMNEFNYDMGELEKSLKELTPEKTK